MAISENTNAIARSHIDLEERIRRRAYEIYSSHGRQGTELDDWLQAEQEILGANGSAAQNRATVVGYAGRPDREETDNLGEA